VEDGAEAYLEMNTSQVLARTEN